MTEKIKQQITFEMSLDTNISIAKFEGGSTESNEIAIEIANRINNVLNNLSDKWLSKFLDEVEKSNFDEAYIIFEENKGTLQHSRKVEDLNSLKKMDFLKLDALKRKDFLIFLILFSAMVNDRTDSLSYIDFLLKNYSDKLDADLLQNIILEKANCLAKDGHINLARINYNKVINAEGVSPATIAWSYQGLSIISVTDLDRIKYAQYAADFHFQSGNKMEAVRNLIQISNFKGNIDPKEAIVIFDKCIALYEEKSLVDRELLASLIHRKSNYLYKINQIKEALILAERACDLRRGLIGNEIELCSSLSLAEILAGLDNQAEKGEKYKAEYELLKEKIKDENFNLREKILGLISNSEFLSNEFLTEVLASDDSELIISTLLYQSTDKDLSLDDAMTLLEKCRVYAEKERNNNVLDVIYFSIAEKYRVEGLYDDAYVFYTKSLKINQFNQSSVQNCLGMLFQERKWKQAQTFLEERIRIIGELPNVCFFYARALLEDKQYQKALKYFNKSDKSNPELADYQSICIDNLDDSQFESMPIREGWKETITSDIFFEILKEFSNSISTSSRMYFWEKGEDKVSYKWTKNPEEKSKQLLITFLNAKLGFDSTEIIQECRAGAGFIDLYIILPGGLKVIVELKMCGGGYSSTYALSGESQIIHYQQNKTTNLGYLVVFDGRTRDYGKGFKEIQNINNHTIYAIAVDMRHTIDKSI
ncbi:MULTISPECIES: tetratricopeptide repeat protein [Acinetobacter]|uniref:tetratricopeptide repeat protein n=1 Tax=Acinetobacter TaxID=469 RepID=UPI00124EE751|nr:MULTISPECIES: tetratricopeptide repeat protein [Acinetobacter]EKW4080636.1 tetratricopeptide repeat protein [Acinetobacter baumannii]QVR67361.1 tetratricopeptide repeat protein [Acinetobacter sp. BHS4]